MIIALLDDPIAATLGKRFERRTCRIERFTTFAKPRFIGSRPLDLPVFMLHLSAQ
jgi:hypothetical protein